MKIVKIAFIIILILLYKSYFLQKVYAQEHFSLSIDPPIIQINAIPPSSFSTPITVTNNSSLAINLLIVLKPFTQSSDQNGQIQFLTDVNNFAGNDPFIKEKMQLEYDHKIIQNLILEPQEEKTLNLHISLPKDEPPSDYYYSVLFISKDNLKYQKNGAGVIGGIATNVLLSIGPKGKTTGTLGSFSSPLIIQNGPVAFSLVVKNTSNFFIVPKGIITLKNMFGQTVGNINLLPVNILARSQRYIPDNKSGSLQNAWWPEKILFGPYSATLHIELSPDGPLFVKTIYFFAMPFPILIGIILGGFIFAIITIRVKKRLQNIPMNKFNSL
jgi:hypothetical protein